MIRRLAIRLRNQDWVPFGIELLILFIGVFLGLQADNWNKERIINQTVKVYYDRLLDDINANTRDLKVRQSYYRQVKNFAESTLEQLSKPTEDLSETFLINAYQASQIIEFSVNRATYDEIISVGAMSTIPNIDTRKRLVNYYVAFESVLEFMRSPNNYREVLRSVMPISLQRIIVKNCGDKEAINTKGEAMVILADTCNVNLNETEIQLVVENLRNHPELKSSLNRELSNIDLKLYIIERYISRTEILAEHLIRSR